MRKVVIGERDSPAVSVLNWSYRWRPRTKNSTQTKRN